jgi:hypothetical protein
LESSRTKVRSFLIRTQKTVQALLCCVFLLVAAYAPAAAGAWVRAKSGYFFKLSGSHLYTTEEFDEAGDIREIRGNEPSITNTSYRESALTGYLEYGLTGRLTLVANLPFKIVTSRRTEAPSVGVPEKDVEVVTGGLSDLTASGRYLLIGGATPVSVQGGLKLPLGYDPSPPEEGAPLGSGKIDVEGHLLAGASLYPVPAYITGQFGYRWRGGTGIADEYLFQVEIGLTPGSWLIKTTLDGVYSAGTPDDRGSATTTVTNQDVLKLIPTVGYTPVPWFTFGAEAFFTLEGKNIVAGTTWALAVVITR